MAKLEFKEKLKRVESKERLVSYSGQKFHVQDGDNIINRLWGLEIERNGKIIAKVLRYELDEVKVENLAKELFKQHGLSDWQFKWDNAIRRFGVCRYSNKTISLSKTLSPFCSLEGIKNTILHEIAHALAGAENHHNHIWQAKAIEIGCSARRCGYVAKPYFYFAICKNGHKHYSDRKVVGNSCGVCTKEPNPEYVLEFEKTEISTD